MSVKFNFIRDVSIPGGFSGSLRLVRARRLAPLFPNVSIPGGFSGSLRLGRAVHGVGSGLVSIPGGFSGSLRLNSVKWTSSISSCFNPWRVFWLVATTAMSMMLGRIRMMVSIPGGFSGSLRRSLHRLERSRPFVSIPGGFSGSLRLAAGFGQVQCIYWVSIPGGFSGSLRPWTMISELYFHTS